MTAFIIIFSVAYLILALKRLEIALFILIAALPAYLVRFNILSLPSTLLEIMILISFATWFIKKYWLNLKDLFKKPASVKSYPFSGEIIALVILAFIAAGIAGFNASALGAWKAYFFEPILVFILIMNVFQDAKKREKIYWAFLISSIAISLFAIYQKITGAFISNEFWAATETRRVISVFEYPNAVGLYLAPLIMILSGWLFSIYKNNYPLWQKLLIIITISSSILAIYFAKSDGALIGLLTGFIIFGLLANRRLRIITIVSGLLIAIGVLIYAPVREKIIDKISFQDLSGQIRLQQWRETGKVLSGLNIITGAGLANYQNAVAPHHQEGIFFNRDKIANFHALARNDLEMQKKYWQPVEIYLYPHNIFLNFWTEIGLFGALLFMWIIIKAIIMSSKAASVHKKNNSPVKYISLSFTGALIVISIHGLVDVPYFKNDLSVMFFIILALIGLYYYDNKYGETLNTAKK